MQKVESTKTKSSEQATIVRASAATAALVRIDSGGQALNTILTAASTPNTTRKIAMNWRQSAAVGRTMVREDRMQAIRDGGSLRAGQN